MRYIFVATTVLVLGAMAFFGFGQSAFVRPYLGPLRDASDRVLHSLFSGLLTVSFHYIWEYPPTASTKKTVLVTGAAMFTFCIASEVFQGLSPYRSFDGKDIAFNLLGAGIGLVLCVIIDKIRVRIHARNKQLRWRNKLQEPEEEQQAMIPMHELEDEDGHEGSDQDPLHPNSSEGADRISDDIERQLGPVR
ncbi:uncharacterized protein BJ171DRAFT_138678 [Polychytrium aggregatum]|uniref:uncharacterized protein n=1 Tax=Polychytrium aggregatum TaxID=110093 RepID=UPI0022FE7DB5|nr:uncharacterized protein BJ171DRAFT_138678 [Polychytrium aggregatum]KAI9203677.1 hypothetical protein BJ171DRAFT_138678 [Polychytrium aggregatum]